MSRRSILTANCYTNCQLSIISTYVHGEARTSLGQLVSIYYTDKYATNIQQIEMLALASIIIGVNNRDPPSTAVLSVDLT